MAAFASIGGQPIFAGRLLIPSVGLWSADVWCAAAPDLSGPVALVVGNLILQGCVFRSSTYGGQTRARVVGGAGGWRKVLAAQGYSSSTGIKLSMVLGDAANAAGERVSVTADTNIGNAFARLGTGTLQGPASDVLWQMVELGFIPGWYVDASGTTQTSLWPATTVSTPFTVADQEPDAGRVSIATEDYASWLPGASFSSPLTAGTTTVSGVEQTFLPDGTARLDVLTDPASADRVLGPFRELVRRETAPLRYHGRYRYVVSNPTSTTIDGTPCNAGLGLPDLTSVPIVADSIASFIPGDGSICRIQFADGDPTQPECVWCQADATIGPSVIILAPNGQNVQPAFRQTDTVVSQFPPLAQLAGNVSGAPFVGVAQFTTPAVGAGQTGSSITKIG